MTSISSTETITPRSLPTSPTTAGSSNERSFLADDSPNSKGKQREVDLGYNDFENDDHEGPARTDNAAYPPTNYDADETRRIEENLRRWDAVERQRRKSARDATPTSPSLVGDVSRRASQLWSGKRPRDSSSLGTHVALQSHENINGLPLDDINATPTPSPSPSPSPSAQPDVQDPFANPPSQSLSPFADPHQHGAVMAESPSSSLLSGQSPDPAASSPYTRGPPMPLGLPPPRTPPPPRDSTTSPPSAPLRALDDQPKTRWWHDWLCGCGEGPDRGGDYQAGRTNPFE